MNADAVALLLANPVLATLDEQHREAFLQLVEFIEIDAPGSIIVREGALAQNVYLILEGEAEVLRHEGEREFPLATLAAGDLFGETALVRAVKRTATIRTRTPMRLAMIKAREVRESPSAHPWLPNFLLELVRQDASRLNRLTNQAVQSLDAEIDTGNRLLALSRLLIYSILSLSIYAIALSFTARYVAGEFAAALIVNGLFLVLGAVFLRFMVTSPYPLSFFGLRWSERRGREIVETVVVSAGLVGLLTVLKLGLLATVPELRGFELFPPMATGFVELVYVLIYAVFMPLQELCVRGGLQSSLEEVFAGHEQHGTFAILLSNAMFAAVIAQISPVLAIVTFANGTVWGVLYGRHRSLLGVSISHVIVSVWMLRVLDFMSLVAVS